MGNWTFQDSMSTCGESSMANSSTMIVTNTPGADLLLTNYAFCSSSDIQRFVISRFGQALASIGSSMVLTLRPHESIVDGLIALNDIQQRHARISTGDTVSVSRFVPPEKKFKLVLLTLDLEFVKAKGETEQLDAVDLGKKLQKRFSDQVFTMGQRAAFKYYQRNYIFTVKQTIVEGQGDNENIDRGMLSKETHIIFEAASNSGIKIMNQREAASSNIFKQKDFDLQKLGIGGLAEQFQDLFLRPSACRVLRPLDTNKLDIKHVKGMLLHGPPGTGKLNGKEPMTRGSTRDGTGVHDRIGNQLLTKIDGVKSLNNVSLTGMTNRKNLIDEALLRPGCLENPIEIGLPDEKRRLQIFREHTSKMKENSSLAADVNLEQLAARTKNFSGCEIEGVVQHAFRFALGRQLNYDDTTKPLYEENIKVTMDDFLCALKEVKAAFGAAIDDLEKYRLNGIVDCGERHNEIFKRVMLLVEKMKCGEGSPLVTCLLEGPPGSGKTSTAATVGIESNFPFVKVVSAESMIELCENSKCKVIAKVFEDAYKSPLSIIILDDIERLLDLVVIGPRCSRLISQTLLVLLKKIPPKGRNLLVIGTTSEASVLKYLGIRKAFGISFHVPTLGRADTKKVLQPLCLFAENDLDAAVEAIDEIPIKKLFMSVDMAAGGQKGNSAEAIYRGKEKININHFFNCLRYLTGNDDLD